MLAGRPRGGSVVPRAWIARVAVGACLAIALTLRLHHLHRYVLRGDEGVYLESLLLMGRGFVPFRDFFSSQGPLFLPLLFPFSLLGGVLGPRLGVVFYVALGLLACAALGRRLGGGVGAATAVLLLALSPNLLYVSRLALAEAPAAGLAAVAVWLAARAPDRRWLVAAAIVLAAAFLVKPLAAAAGLAIVPLLLAARIPHRDWRALAIDLLLVAGVGLGVCLLASLPFGLSAVRDQFVDFHVDVTRVEQRGRAVGGWDNVASAVPQLVNEGVGLYLLALVGAATALARRRALELGIVLWLAATVALLWIYVPFYDRYLAFLLAPLALLGATAAAEAASLAGSLLTRRTAAAHPPTAERVVSPPLPQREGRGEKRSPHESRPSSTRTRAHATGGAAILQALGLVAAAAYVLSLPSLVTLDRFIAESAWEPLRLAEYQAAVDLAAASAAGDLVATDNQSVAFMAGRLVPPPLVDTSEARVTSGSIDAEEAIRALDEYGVNVVVWWSEDRFGKLRGFRRELEERFDLAREYANGRALYLRRGVPAANGGPPAADSPEG